jgi:diguanylate cyclase (GGDEF)-like protein
MIDLDGLKAVNDNLGHQRGDEVLRSLGRTIRSSIRTVDSAYRYGGDEFLVLLPETDFSGAFVVAEKIRSDAEEMGYRLEAEGTSTSVSIGLVSHPEDGGTADELVRAADRAMYNAKALGKNQISGYPRPPRLAGPGVGRPPEEDTGPAHEPMPEPPTASPAPEPEVAPAFAEGIAAEPVAVRTEPMTAAIDPIAAERVDPADLEPDSSAFADDAFATASFDEAWVAPAADRVNLPVGSEQHTEEEEPDAEEVRRQIVAASRSFDPDHQIRRAMDAFLSPPGHNTGGRPD